MKELIKIFGLRRRYLKQNTKGVRGVKKVISEAYTISRMKLSYYYYLKFKT